MKQNTITKEHIDLIVSQTKFDVSTVFDKCTVVTAKLPNGFVITESSACVDPSNYDKEKGFEICKERIINKIWELEGYKLQDMLYEIQDSNNTDKNFIAKFEKVSQKQFYKDINCSSISETMLFYNDIKLPKRATKSSAGYDFFLPYSIEIQPHDTFTVSTGIRCKMDSNYVLMIHPRSGLGFKYGLRLHNSCAIIDSDFAHSDNEGNIKIKLYNPSDNTIYLNQGEAFCQGIFLPYGLAVEEEVTTIRNGGLGSTSK